MKNREKLAKMNNQEIANYLCSLHIGCSNCIGYKLCECGGGHGNGIKKWLESEIEEENT